MRKQLGRTQKYINGLDADRVAISGDGQLLIIISEQYTLAESINA